jgi:hypothetical protein
MGQPMISAALALRGGPTAEMRHPVARPIMPAN